MFKQVKNSRKLRTKHHVFFPSRGDGGTIFINKLIFIFIVVKTKKKLVFAIVHSMLAVVLMTILVRIELI